MLRFDFLDFEPYSLKELVGIVKSRIKEAFGKNIVEGLALFEVATFVRNSSQNVRDAFHILEDAMELAQDYSENKVTAEMVRTVIEKRLRKLS